MLISKSNHKGIAISVILSTSGGLIIAAIIKITINACFLYFLKKAGVIILIFVKKKTSTGNSKTRPLTNEREDTREIYDDRLIVFST